MRTRLCPFQAYRADRLDAQHHKNVMQHHKNVQQVEGTERFSCDGEAQCDAEPFSRRAASSSDLTDATRSLLCNQVPGGPTATYLPMVYGEHPSFTIKRRFD